MHKPRVLVISMGSVGPEMAGPGIRSYELARSLAEHFDVTLAAVDDGGGKAAGDLPLIGYELHYPRALRATIANADVIIAQPQWPMTARWMRSSAARLVFDLYDPEPFEVIQALQGRSPLLRRTVSALTLDRIIEALFNGHNFICASGKQRDMWVGMMIALRLLGPRAYDRDPTLTSVIREVPFGLPREPPTLDGGPGGMRERFSGRIAAEDEVVLWNGGIWEWLDAPTAVRAMGILRESRPRAKLVFMGITDIGQAREATREARQVADELGLLDRSVLFNDGWVPYAERGAWLLEADCALSTQVEHLETRFAFRTRLLDCFWARLPIVCTRGDELADLVDRMGAGAAVAPGDARAVAGAIETVLGRGRASYADALGGLAEAYAWPRVTEPLLEWIEDGEHGPRLGDGVRRPPLTAARMSALRATLAAMGALGLRPWPVV